MGPDQSIHFSQSQPKFFSSVLSRVWKVMNVPNWMKATVERRLYVQGHTRTTPRYVRIHPIMPPMKKRMWFPVIFVAYYPIQLLHHSLNLFLSGPQSGRAVWIIINWVNFVCPSNPLTATPCIIRGHCVQSSYAAS